MTVKRIGDEEFDLIDNLHGFVRLLTLALWRRLATENPTCRLMARSRCASRAWPRKPDDALALLESGYAAANGDAAAFKKWFDKSGRKAMERVETDVAAGGQASAWTKFSGCSRATRWTWACSR